MSSRNFTSISLHQRQLPPPAWVTVLFAPSRPLAVVVLALLMVLLIYKVVDQATAGDQRVRPRIPDRDRLERRSPTSSARWT